MNRDQLIRRTEEVIKQANRAFSLSLPVPTIGFFSTGVRAGFANPKKNRVEYNEVLARENPNNFDWVVVHEVGHLVTKKAYPKAKQWHGPEFREVMRVLGGKENTHHKFEVNSVKQERILTRHVAKCACSTHNLTTARAKIIDRLHCKSCKGKVVLTGETKTISNIKR